MRLSAPAPDSSAHGLGARSLKTPLRYGIFSVSAANRKSIRWTPRTGAILTPAGVHCVEQKRKPWNPGQFRWHPKVKRVVFDEAHRCGAWIR
jgi:hypothetical protein